MTLVGDPLFLHIVISLGILLLLFTAKVFAEIFHRLKLPAILHTRTRLIQLINQGIRSNVLFNSAISFFMVSSSVLSAAYFRSRSHASSSADIMSFLSIQRPWELSIKEYVTFFSFSLQP